jgi:hypothetical protein
MAHSSIRSLLRQKLSSLDTKIQYVLDVVKKTFSPRGLPIEDDPEKAPVEDLDGGYSVSTARFFRMA